MKRWFYLLLVASGTGCQLETRGTSQSSVAVEQPGTGGAATSIGESLGGADAQSGGASSTFGSSQSGAAGGAPAASSGGAAVTAMGGAATCDDAEVCPSGFACILKRCDPAIQCTRSIDCPGQLVCDRSTAHCVECQVDADCADAAKSCRNAVCTIMTNGGSASGGANGSLGGTTSSGGATGGTNDVSGGDAGDSSIESGGTAASGGTTLSMGGSIAEIGGAPSGAGGNSTGSGGTPGSGGRSMSTGGTTGSSGSSSACASGANPCSSITQFTATQVVDGIGDEFCEVPSFELNFANAVKVIEYNGPYGRAHYPERAIANVAWSTRYVHAFIRVIDPYVVKADSIDYIWGADSVELMISANKTVTGSTANDASTLRLIAAPWAKSALGMAASVRTSGTSSVYTQLTAGQYAVVVDAEGYSVELQVPWPSNLTANAASRVYFDLALNAAVEDITSGTNVRDAQAIYYQGIAPGMSPCGSEILPYCDDRTWCLTNLD